MIEAYPVALFAHVLVVVYLLGADLGRVYLARRGAAANIAEEARSLAAGGVAWLGSATNFALVLILPIGVSLGGVLGVYRILSPGWLVATWLVALLWALLSIASDRSASLGHGRGLWFADIALRLILAPGFLYDGAIVFLGTSLTVDAEWLAAKLMLFGLLILVTIPSRWAGFEVRRALVTGDQTALEKALNRLTWPLVVGWIVILWAAWFGVAKPL